MTANDLILGTPASTADSRDHDVCDECGHERRFHSVPEATGAESGDCMIRSDSPDYCDCEDFR